MGIEAFVVAQVVSSVMGAKAAGEESEANIAREDSAEKSRALAATVEFNDMMASNVVAGATSGISLASASFIQGVKTSDTNFRLNRASDRITTGNKQREYGRRAKAARTQALINSSMSIIGGYNASVSAAPKGGTGSYFGMKVG